MARKTEKREKTLSYEERYARARQRVRDAETALRETVLGPLMGSLRVVEAPADAERIGSISAPAKCIRLNLAKNLDRPVIDWVYVLGHLALHLGLEQDVRREHRDPWLWNLACEGVVDAFLTAFKIGKVPDDCARSVLLEGKEEELYDRLREDPSLRTRVGNYTLAGPGHCDLLSEGVRVENFLSAGNASQQLLPVQLLAIGIRRGVERAIQKATNHLESANGLLSFPPLERARRFVLSELPLLGALAAQMKVLVSEEACVRMGISIAAVNPWLGEIYFNPRWRFSDEQFLFVYVHELLHVALFHHTRRKGRDPELWNFACDFVINAWLIEMGIGEVPPIGMLFDPTLKNMSVEDVYNLLANDKRRCKGLRTFGGEHCDILWDQAGSTVYRGDVSTLDDVYRRCLEAGIRCTQRGRGLIPLGLLEEIESLFTPPIPWDVKLARWLEGHVPYIREPLRSYARVSRRQSSTPDIPRPARYVPQEWKDACTFGVVLDTSGSMDRELLGRSLGAIASFAEARGVESVRVVLCDARPYDKGFVTPQELRGTVSIQGRGGTRLQPAIGFLCTRQDFPSEAPVMILTDGLCEETLFVPRDHCYVLPRRGHDGAAPTLRTTAPIFEVLKEEELE